MTTAFPPRPIWGRIATLAVLFVTSTTFAATHVKDDGKFFSDAAIQQAETTLAQLQAKTNRSVIVETFAEPPASVRSQIVDDASKRDQVFEQFALGRAIDIKADVYVMANRTPGYLRIAENNTLQAGILPAAERARISQSMLDAFKQKQFDQGLTTGVGQIASFLGSAPVAAARPSMSTPQMPTQSSRRDEPPVAPVFNSPPATSHGMFGGLSCCTIAGIGLLVVIVLAVVRRMGNRGAPVNYGGMPPAGGYPPGAGYPQQGGYPPQAGGGFGRGVAGGLLGGVLGSVLGNQWSRGNSNSGQSGGGLFGGGSGGGDGGGPPDAGYSSSGGSFDPGPTDPGSSGGGFDSGGGGGGDAGGGDSGSSGGSF